MKMWQIAIGFVTAATVGAIGYVWKNGKKLNFGDDIGMQSLLGSDRDDRLNAEAVEHVDEKSVAYKARVKERMLRGFGSLHPPLYNNRGDSGEDKD